MDSDDEWSPEKLALQVEAIEKSTAPSQTVCFTAYIYDHGRGQKIKPSRGLASGESLAEYLFCSHGSLQTSTILIPSELAKSCEFPSLGPEDTDYFLQLERARADFCFIGQPLSLYHAEPRPGRVGLSYSIQELKQWAQTRPHEMSTRAKHGYMATVIAPMLVNTGRLSDRLKATWVFLVGAMLAPLSPEALFYGGLQVFTPRALYFGLQKLRQSQIRPLKRITSGL